MFELRYYFNAIRYEVVGTYDTASLAYGMRKKFAMKEQYQESKLKVRQTQKGPY
jgi:hypothetical protein